LSILSADNQALLQTLLYWPYSVESSWALQSATNLVSQNWVTVSNVIPITVGANVTVIVNTSSNAMFFRLISPGLNPPPTVTLIPAGSFTIGNLIVEGDSTTNDPDITDADPTNVDVSAFDMDVTLVNLSQWQSVYSYATNHGYSFDNVGAGKAANNPVQTVNWYDCAKWCNARSQQAGLTPVYYTDAGMTQVYTNEDVDAVYANWSTNGYRLPTEAEWEKAARGGLGGLRFPWGDLIYENLANYDSAGGFGYDLGPSGYNSIGNYPATTPGTSPGGSFPPNGYGPYDMAGNVFEWCWDWYAGTPYPTGSPYLGGTDPRGPTSSTNVTRVMRGGSWINEANWARCANRASNKPGFESYAVGFRCVREP
jgi:sulfatase modifying factor 1